MAFFIVISSTTLKALLSELTLLLRPHALSLQLAGVHIWTGFADGTDEGRRKVKEGLISPNTYGIVLDIGVGKDILFCSQIRKDVFFTD